MWNCQWLALAELYLLNLTNNVNVHCLCSRVFICDKKINKHNEQNISKKVLSESADENIQETENINGQIHDAYGSSIENKNVCEQDNFEVNGNECLTDCITYSTGYIAEDFNLAWENYWYKHGESLVWSSWIKKYKDFINPEYINAHKNYEDLEAIKSPSKTNGTEAREHHFQNSESVINTSSDIKFEKELSFDDHWTHLWDSHCEEEYFYQYNQFLLKRFSFSNSKDETNYCEDYQINDSNAEMNSLQNLCKKIILKSTVVDKTTDTKESIDESCGKLNINDNKENSNCEMTEDGDDETHNDDFQQMMSLNLPISFGNSRTNKKYNDTSCSNANVSQIKNDSIKAAFELLCVKFNETKGVKTFTGNVNYKVKHIRRQNRKLKIHPQVSDQTKITPKHVFFNDEGEISETKPSSSNILNDCKDLTEELSLEVVKDNGKCIDDKYDEGNAMSTSNTGSDYEDNEYFPENNLLQDVEEQEKYAYKKCYPKKKIRKRKANLPIEIKNNEKLRKYWGRRFSLFSKFDLGVKLDEESWFSVTPEKIAKNTAQRCHCDVIIDAFCGAGGNSIQFALTCNKVIAIDIDPKKIQLARNNAEVYNVADRIEFVIGDFFHLADKLKGDVVFLSPPWGGPSYLNLPDYDLEKFLQPKPLSEVLETARKITENVALFLPRNSNIFPLLVLSGEGKSVEIEQNFLNDRLIALTAYYGRLIKTSVS